MAKKQLVVEILGLDKLSAPIRNAANSVVTLGDQTERASGRSNNALSRMIRHFTSLTGIVQGLAVGLAVRGIVRSFNETSEALSQIDVVAKRTGASVERISEWRFIARRNELSFERLADGVSKAQERVAQFVRTGGGSAAEALSRLNVRLTDTAGRVRSVDDLLPEFLVQLQKIPDVAERIDLSSAVFGGAGDDIVTLANRGVEALARLRVQARQLNAVYSPEQVENARRYQVALRDIGDAWLGLKVRLFDAVGPQLAELAEKFARFLTIVPTLAGNFAKSLSDAFGTGPGAERAYEDVAVFMKNLGDVVVTGIAGIGSIAAVTVDSVLHVVLGMTDSKMSIWFGQFPQKFLIGLQEGYAKALKTFMEGFRGTIPDGIIDRDIRIREESLDAAMQDRMELQREWAAMNRKPAENFAQQFETDFGRGVTDAVAGARAALKPLLSELGVSADRVFKFSEAWAKSAVDMDAVNKELEEMKRQTTEIRGLTFFDGLIRGAADLRAEMANTFELGRQYYGGVTNAIVGGLSTALVNAAGDVKNLGAYMREFASNALRQIAELTTRMLLFRAVAGIGGAFAGGAGLTATDTGLDVPNTFGLATQGAFANTGGFITRTGVRRYAGGGYVPGPNVNRDVVPALLTPGEFVLNRAATARAGAANLARFNRGGAVGGGGVGGGTSVTMVNNITINSSSGNPQELARVLTDAIERYSPNAVLKQMNLSPGYRERMRAAY